MIKDLSNLICSGFELDTIILKDSKGMLEGYLFNQVEEELINGINEELICYLPNTNLKVEEIKNGEIYDITYIEYDGEMKSELSLTYEKLILKINEIKNKIEEGYLNVYNVKDRISFSELKKFKN